MCPPWRYTPSGREWPGTRGETSDLDLTLMTAKPLSIDRTARLRAAFTDSDLPFRVDIVDWATASESFRQRILENHVALRADRDEWPIRRFEELLDEPVRNGIYKSKEHHGPWCEDRQHG